MPESPFVSHLCFALIGRRFKSCLLKLYLFVFKVKDKLFDPVPQGNKIDCTVNLGIVVVEKYLFKALFVGLLQLFDPALIEQCYIIPFLNNRTFRDQILDLGFIDFKGAVSKNIWDRDEHGFFTLDFPFARNDGFKVFTLDFVNIR